MAKKLYLTIFMAALLALTLALFVSADTVHNENTVDYAATVTLNDGTVLPLYDENREALVWYIDGKDENGNTKYSSVITDKTAKWYTESWNEVTGFGIVLEDGTQVNNNNLVVINMMDDDVVKNSGPGTKYYGEPVTDFKTMVQGRKNLEYFYLRLDTKTINNSSFAGCSKLKYINLENLTMLRRMAQNNQFSGCTSLFEGQVLDLSKTQLTEFEGSGTFGSVPVKGIKFPKTMTKIGSERAFNNCTSLEFISVGNKTKIGINAFDGCTSFEAIYYVGTLDELNSTTIVSLLDGATVTSYTEYKALADKSGQYIVYNYSSCEAFNGGIHGEITDKNPCVGICNVCQDFIINHWEDASLGTAISYTDYTAKGVKVSVCQNEGCTYRTEAEAPALFRCLGYSVAESGTVGIVIGYTVNKAAIAEYTELSEKTVRYGVFVVLQEKLLENEIFDENGKAASGVLSAEMSNRPLDVFELKIVGFSNEQKDIKLAMGAYVAVTDGETTEYSYMQGGTPGENEKYYFVSYNDIAGVSASE